MKLPFSIHSLTRRPPVLSRPAMLLLRGTFFLTAAGILTRVMGFFYRIFLSRAIGAEGMGIYQLIFPVYGIALSLCASGIQTAVSRLCAAQALSGRPTRILRAGLVLSLSLSLLVSLFLYGRADFLADTLLLEPRCAPLLRALAFCVPLSSLHSCINGYYYSLQKAGIPALSQLLEQGARMLFLWLAWQVCLQEQTALTLDMAIWAIAAGEAAAVLCTLTALAQSPSGPKLAKASPGRADTGLLPAIRLILPIAAPLTLTRLLVSGLGSAEAVLIPNRLAAYGYSTATSLSIYGIFTGMAMPLVLFPTAVTAAVSVLLLPTVAKAQSSHRHAQISHTIYATVKCCLLLGIFCFGIFLTYGKEIGIFLFGNALAGEFLRILSWLCPFLYLSSALSSILNGLGKTFAVFRNQMASLAIRIAFVVFFIPLFGIQGCLWGLLGSQLFLSLAGLAALRPFMDFPFPAYDWIARPCFYLFLSVGLSLAITPLAEPLASLSPLLPLCVRIAAAGAAYVLLLSCAEIIRLYKSRQLRQNSI